MNVADGQIRIRISASQDAASFDRAFGDLVKRAQRAGKDIQKALNPGGANGGGAGGALTKSMQGAATAADKAAKSAEKSWNQQLAALNRVARAQDAIFNKQARDRQRATDQAARAAQRAAEQEARAVVRAAEKSARERVRIEERAQKEIERAFRAATREAEREEKKRARAAEREAAKASRAREQFASRVSHRTTRFLFPPPEGILGAAGRVANGLMMGAGIDTTLQGGVRRHFELSSASVALANQERIATGRTQGSAFYSASARAVADQTFSSAGDVAGLQSRFSAGAGTYGSALNQIIPQLASMARVSGANFDDTGAAAASVYNQLKDGPDAIKKTIEVMRAVIGQSAEGAVDMPEYASQLSRIAAGGFKFEGDRGTNIAKLSALTQLARERGATSAADAARGTTSFVSTLGKGARLKELEKAGVRVYTDDTLVNGKVKAGSQRDTLRDPFEIIKDSFKATNGNIPQMGKMFMDVLSRKGIESLGAVYKNAGGGDEGIKAIQGELDRYMAKTLTADVEKQNLKDIENSPEGKAQRFQNNLDKIVSTMADRLIPAMDKLSGPALSVANAFAKMVTFVAENPFKALSAAVSLAIARAFAEAKLRDIIERGIKGSSIGMIPGSPGGGGGGPGAIIPAGGGGGRAGPLGITGGGLGVAGNLFAGLQIATLAVTTLQVGTATIDSFFTGKEDKQRKDALTQAELGSITGKALMAARNGGGITPEEAEKLASQRELLEARIQAAERYKEEGAGGGDEGWIQLIGTMLPGAGSWARKAAEWSDESVQANLDGAHIDALKAELAEQKRILSDIRGGVIRVEVINQPADQPRVGNEGRGSQSDSD